MGVPGQLQEAHDTGGGFHFPDPELRRPRVSIDPKRDFLTTAQAGALLGGKSSQTIINWIDAGRFPCRRVGRGPREIPIGEFKNYLESIGYPIPEELLTR